MGLTVLDECAPGSLWLRYDRVRECEWVECARARVDEAGERNVGWRLFLGGRDTYSEGYPNVSEDEDGSGAGRQLRGAGRL